MLINKVTLKNYRIHSIAEISFEKGINLLLGQNGSGKSSILEAIGLALFDADLRSSQADAIKKGEKSASILVEFTGNDENNYVVEKKLGSAPLSRLYLQGDKSSRIEGKDAVLKKVMEVCGIISNEKKIYQNVITAYQNKIISIFAERPVEREKIFDTIFDTDIYRQIYERYLKKAKDNYSEKYKIENGNILFIKEQLMDTKELKGNLKSQKDIHKELSIKLKGITTKISNTEKTVKELEKVKQNINKLAQDITHLNELYNTKEEERNKSEKQLAEAKKSLEVIKNTKSDYESYLKVEKKLKQLTDQIIPLEKTENQVNTEKEKLYTLNGDKKTLSKELELLNKDKNEKENISKKNNLRLKEDQKELIILGKALSELGNKGKRISQVKEDFNLQLEKINDFKNREKELLNDKERLTKELPDLEKVHITLNKEEKNRLNLQEKLQRKEKLEKEKHAAEHRLSETEEAEKILSNQTCPYLNEKCLNIQNNSSPEKYFKNKKAEIETVITTINNEVKIYQNLNSELEKSIQNISLLKRKQEQGKTDSEKINQIKQKLELLKKDFEITRLEIKNIISQLSDYNENLQKYFLISDYTSIKEILEKQVNDLRVEYKGDGENLNNKKAIFNELSGENKKIIRESDQIAQEIESKEKMATEINNLITQMSDKLKELQKIIQPLAELKKQRSKETDLLEKLKNNYTSHLSHKTKANEIPVIEKNKIRLETELSKLKNTNSLQKEKLNELENQFSEDSYLEHQDKIKKLNDGKENTYKNIYETETLITSLQDKIEKNKQLKKNLEEKQKQINTYKSKLDLTEKFRNNIKGMGKLVARRLINQIAQAASSNYRQISGKSEDICWENSEKDSYTVYLTQGNNVNSSRSFEQLSGGEQVAVALSLRAAMASTLTKSHFAVFDEPTINLDKEKRIALAESIKYILKNLHQAIIVTHDDTFREMAQKTIILE